MPHDPQKYLCDIRSSRVVFFIFGFAACAIAGCGNAEKKQHGRKQLAEYVAEQLEKATSMAGAYDFGGADSSLRELADLVEKSPYADVRTHEKLMADIRSAQDSVAAQKSEYDSRVRAGWIHFEGRFISREEKDQILAERQRAADEERATAEAARVRAEQFQRAFSERQLELLKEETRRRRENLARRAAEREATERRISPERYDGPDFTLVVNEIGIVASPYWRKYWQDQNEHFRSLQWPERTWEAFCEPLGGVQQFDRLRIALTFRNTSERQVLTWCSQVEFVTGQGIEALSAFRLTDDVGNSITRHFEETHDSWRGSQVEPGGSLAVVEYFDVPRPGTKYLLLEIDKRAATFNVTSLHDKNFSFKIPVACIGGLH